MANAKALPPMPRLPGAAQMLWWIARPIELMRRMRARHGPTFTVHFPGNPPIVIFAEPDAIKDIFTADYHDAHAGEANRILEPLLGKGSLLLLDGERHMRERKLLMPPFHGERMVAYGDVMRRVADADMDAWPRGRPFPIHPALQRITLDVITQTVFGLGDRAEHAEIRDRLSQLTNLAANPLMMLPWIQVDLGPRSPWGKIARLKSDIDRLLIDEIRERRRTGGEDRHDVLSLLVSARHEDGSPMSDEDLKDQMVTLLVAGHETTATALAWTLHRLTSHPAALERAYEEVDRVGLEAKRVGELTWIDAVVRESLRLHPIIPIVGRLLKKPMTIGGVDLPEGVVAGPCIYLAQRDPDAWPDPERFDPARFVGKKISPYAWLPFGGSTRRCLGMAFSLYEMKVVLAAILKRFWLHPVPGYRARLVRRGISFAPSEEMPIWLTDRRTGTTRATGSIQPAASPV